MEYQPDPLKPQTTTTTTNEIAAKEPTVPKSVPKECSEDDNDEESWFELELTFPKPPDSSTNPPRKQPGFCKADTDSDLGCSKRRASMTSTSSDDSTISTTSFYRDHHHIRRMESPDVRLSTEKSPRSPISIIRTPTLRRLMFGAENRSVKEENAETYSNFAAVTPSRSWSRRGVRFFSVRVRIEDVSKYRQSNSSRSSRSSRSSTSRVSIPERRSVDAGEASSRRLTKYLNFFRPLYLKVSEKDKLKEEFCVGVPSAAGIGSPARKGWMWSPMRATTKERDGRRSGSRFGGNAKKLSKSRSASSSSANVGVDFSPASRKDDSMKQQKDGIEGAILHCKQTLNSSSVIAERSCALARCTSDSASNGKSLQRL